MSLFSFPDNFFWGAATSSYQIEGAYNEDGKGLSTWDVFTKRKGKIKNNDNGDIACNHYHLYKEDVALMKELGLNAYRFSFSWSRVMPDGEGKINQKGLDFYNNLIDELLKANIVPFVTLFHWDLPNALEEKYGGWRSKEVSKLFAEFSGIIAKNISDRVKLISTMNEITCFTNLAHEESFNEVHAPGKIESKKVANQTVHNAMLGHGLACQAIRANSPDDVKIGIVDNPSVVMPVFDTYEHIEASKKAYQNINAQITFPLNTGKYSDYFIKNQENDLPDFTEEEMKIISYPTDFTGYNFYTAKIIGAKDNQDGYEIIPFPVNYPKTKTDWPLTPKGIYYMLKYHKDFFGNKDAYIAENGCSVFEEANDIDEVYDLDRLEYYRQHLQMVNSAYQDGVNIKGYFAWSLMDNFEWSQGYEQRFGITRVNFETLKRTIKLSGKYYSEVIKANKVI